MKLFKNQNTLFSFLVAFALLGNFSWNPSYIEGISYDSNALLKLEKKVFQKISADKRDFLFEKEQRTRLQIVRVLSHVISKYHTGLDNQTVRMLPNLILEESGKYGYDPLFITALIITESSFNNWAQSKVGALGLMQIKPRTAFAVAKEKSMRWRGKPSLFHPETNIAIGSYYLNKMHKRFQDMELALEAYNHGPTQLMRFLHKGNPPYKYSSKVFSIYDDLKNQTI